MKRLLALATIVLTLGLTSVSPVFSTSQTSKPSSSSKKVYVKGYYRKDGTYVPPHYRDAPGTGDSGATAPKPPKASSPKSPSTTGGHPKGCQTCPRDENGKILRDPAARAQFMRMTGYPHGRPGYVVDHIIPLECGGSDTPGNMQWQTIAAAKAKDKGERNCRQ
jgi:hypothetical protein